MANLFAYLYVTCYDDESGNPTRGRQLFTEERVHPMPFELVTLEALWAQT